MTHVSEVSANLQEPIPSKASRIVASSLAAVALLGIMHETASPAAASRPDKDVFDNPSIARTQLQGEPFTVATYNILGSNHVASGHRIGGSVVARAHRTVATIKGKGSGPRFDVVGMQEVEPNQRRMFDRMLSGYNSVPGDKSSPVPIFYNTKRFKLLDTDIVHYPFYDDRGRSRKHGKATEARLQDKKTGAVINVINSHFVAWNEKPGSDDQGAKKRAWSSNIMQQAVRKNEKQHPSDTQFVTGDLNSDFFRRNQPTRNTYFNEPRDRAVSRNSLPYCILTKQPKLLQNTYDMAIGKSGHCPSVESPFSTNQYNIDHIFYEPPAGAGTSTYVVKWERVRNNTTKRSSDHDPNVATLQLGQAGAAPTQELPATDQPLQ